MNQDILNGLNHQKNVRKILKQVSGNTGIQLKNVRNFPQNNLTHIPHIKHINYLTK